MEKQVNSLPPAVEGNINQTWLWTARVILVVDLASQWELAKVCSSPSLQLSPTSCYSYLVVPYIAALLLLIKKSMLRWGLLLAAGLGFLILFWGGIVGYGLGSWIGPLQVVLIIAAYKAQRALPQGHAGMR